MKQQIFQSKAEVLSPFVPFLLQASHLSLTSEFGVKLCSHIRPLGKTLLITVSRCLSRESEGGRGKEKLPEFLHLQALL